MAGPDLRPALTGVAGVPEAALGEDLLARLPVDVPPAPWTCDAQGVVWCARGSAAATAALPPALRGSASGLAVVGGIVRYSSTPVGPYDEVFGLVGSHSGVQPWGSVAFMSVDSEASLVGGRANWAMPKTLAEFTGEPGSGRTMTATGEGALGWRVTVRPTAYGPLLPMRSRGRCRQEFPDGRLGDSLVKGRGRIRVAVVDVEVESDGPLPTWLRPGRHLGAVVESARFSMTEPAFG
jgi:hypothetical protein